MKYKSSSITYILLLYLHLNFLNNRSLYDDFDIVVYQKNYKNQSILYGNQHLIDHTVSQACIISTNFVIYIYAK